MAVSIIPSHAPADGLAVSYRASRGQLGLDDRLHLTRNFGLNASAFVDIDMGKQSKIFLHIDD